MAFFVTFIELANLIFINIIIAFIIDTYQSIDLTLKAESDARRLQNRKINPVSAEDGNNSLLKELNNNPAQFTRIMEILNQQQEKNESVFDEEPADASLSRSATTNQTTGSDSLRRQSKNWFGTGLGMLMSRRARSDGQPQFSRQQLERLATLAV